MEGLHLALEEGERCRMRTRATEPSDRRHRKLSADKNNNDRQQRCAAAFPLACSSHPPSLLRDGDACCCRDGTW
jgi:hypothetical protein